MKKKLLTLILGLTGFYNGYAQEYKQESQLWYLWLNSAKINKNWALHFDAQIRTYDATSQIKHTLIRPGVTYHLNNKTNFTVGYLWNTTLNRSIVGQSIVGNEHRAWEQFIYAQKLSQRVNLNHRFRLEQRFLEQQNQNKVFAQRFRYFFRTVLPLDKNKDAFKQGMFAAMQNEVFVNVQNKGVTSGNFFDQNRAYAAIGYRVSPKFDIETGYLNQYVNGRNQKNINHNIQLAVYTRF